MARLPGAVLVAVALLACAACATRGQEVFVVNGCADCHRFRGPGGGLGPDLSDIASRQTPAAIRKQITNPASLNPASRMPSFDHLGWYDLESLVAYLRS